MTAWITMYVALDSGPSLLLTYTSTRTKAEGRPVGWCVTLWCVELRSPPTESRGLEESSEDSDELDHAVPLSTSSWRRSMF